MSQIFKKTLYITALFFLPLLVKLCMAQESAQIIPGAIKGKIIDSENNLPLTGASIQLIKHIDSRSLEQIIESKSTDCLKNCIVPGCVVNSGKNGCFELPSIPLSQTRHFSLLAKHDGYITCLIENIDVEPGASLASNIEISLYNGYNNINILSKPRSYEIKLPPIPPLLHRDARQIFATREGLVGGTTANGHIIKERDRFAALPSKKSLCKNDSESNKTYQVQLFYRSKTCTVPIWDIGPWNTKDDYWNASSIREMWNDLAQFLPEAQAAYQNKYNDGKDGSGRKVLNPAGIDLADGVFWDDLAMTDNDWIEVRYLWQESAIIKGDIDKDGILTSNDAKLCLNIILGFLLDYPNNPTPHNATSDEIMAADFNSDGSVAIDDSTLIMKNSSDDNL